MKTIDDSYLVREKGVFWVDREHLDTGRAIVAPGEKISFKWRGKSYTGTVSDVTRGRDDDVYKVITT